MSYSRIDENSCSVDFVIKGRSDDEMGNPLPKIRKTFRQRHTPEVARYIEWKEWVRAACLDGLGKKGERELITPKTFASGKLLDTGKEPAFMRIMIFFAAKGAHPDPENVFGSIADALFVNDNLLSGAFSFAYAAPGKPPRVEVHLELPI